MRKFLAFIIILLALPIALAVDFTPSGNMNGRNIYSIFNFTNISSNKAFVNGSPVCTSTNGLCLLSDNNAGWNNESNITYTNLSIQIGSNANLNGYQFSDKYIAIDGPDESKAFTFAQNGIPVADGWSTYKGENLSFLYGAYWYKNQATTLVISESNRVGVNKDGNVMDVGLTGVSFRGTGKNDVSISGIYDKEYSTEYVVIIVNTNHFALFSSVNGADFEVVNTSVLINSPTQFLVDGININFGSNYGYTPGDNWFFIGQTQRPPATFSISPIGYRYVLSTKDSGITFKDETMAAASANTVDINTVIDNGPIDNDTYLYLGSGVKQNNIYVELTQGADNFTLEVQYPTSQNTWKTLNKSNLLVDETFNLSQTGGIFYSMGTMTDWNSSISIDNITGLYWLRLHSSSLANVTPLINGINPNADNRLCILAHPQDTICSFYITPKGDLKSASITAGEDYTKESYASDVLDESFIIHKKNSNNMGLILANIDDYAQFRIKNVNSGTKSSSVIVIENDRNTSDNYYGEFGCNGQNYAPGTGPYDQPDYCFLNSESSPLTITTGDSSKPIYLGVGHGSPLVELNSAGLYVQGSQVCTATNGLCSVDADVNLTEIVNNIGNWSADKPNYYIKNETYNQSQIDNILNGGNSIYWFTNQTNLANNRNMTLYIPNGTFTELTYPITTNKISLGTFITPKTSELTVFSAGTRHIIINVHSSSSNKIVELQTIVSRCINYNESTDICDGGLVGFANSTVVSCNSDVADFYEMTYYVNSTYILNSSDRFILNITALKTSGGNTNFILAVDDGSYSRIEVPSPSKDISQLAHVGDCPVGEFVVNTTTSGVECKAPTGIGTVTQIDTGFGIDKAIITSTGTISINITAVVNNIGNFSENKSAIWSNASNQENEIQGLLNSNTSLNNKVSSLVNLTIGQVTTANGNWSVDKSSYTTTGYVQSIGNWSADKSNYALNSKVNSLVNLTIGQVTTANGNWTADKSGYTTTGYVQSIGNWTADKTSYTLDSKTNSLVNLTIGQVTTANGNWSADKSSYTLLSYTQSLGNWSADKSGYTTTGYVQSVGNWSADKSSYATTGLVSSIGNFSENKTAIWTNASNQEIEIGTLFTNASNQANIISGLINSNTTIFSQMITINNLSNSSIASLMSNSTIARTGTCSAGTVVQNTTTSGVQCVTASTGGGYTTIKDESTTLAQQTTLVMQGAGVTCVNDAVSSSTNCTIPSGGTGGSVNGTSINVTDLVVVNNGTMSNLFLTAGGGIFGAGGIVNGTPINITSLIIDNDGKNNTLTMRAQLSDAPIPNAGYATLSVKTQGGRNMFRAIGPSGMDYNLQPSIYQQRIVQVMPGATTAITQFGTSVATTNMGTLSTPTFNSRYGQRTLVTNSTTTSNVSIFMTNMWVRGENSTSLAGAGGWYSFDRLTFENKSAIYTGVFRNSSIIFVGFTSGTATSMLNNNTETLPPGSYSGFYYSNNTLLTANNNWTFITSNGTATVGFNVYNTSVPFNPGSVVDFYQYCPPGCQQVSFRVADQMTGQFYEGVTTSPTQLPVNNTLLYHGFAGAQVRPGLMPGSFTFSIGMIRMYVETDR